ncbi:MAG TPA: hypothetical protein VFJ57_15030 [Solirubrobacterales bacterium]|nr:hypothetical protein [Solirubrobacterales bacterium]
MGFRRRGSGVAIVAVAAALGAMLAAAGALATTSPTQTPESYAAQVEPVCKANTKANERILANVRGYIKQGKLKLAGTQFLKASEAFGKAVKQIAAVPQPTADAAKLEKWLGYLDDQTKLLAETGKALKAGKKTRAQEQIVRLRNNANLANNTVLSFEFRYCKIEQSRFT